MLYHQLAGKDPACQDHISTIARYLVQSGAVRSVVDANKAVSDQSMLSNVCNTNDLFQIVAGIMATINTDIKALSYAVQVNVPPSLHLYLTSGRGLIEKSFTKADEFAKLAGDDTIYGPVLREATMPEITARIEAAVQLLDVVMKHANSIHPKETATRSSKSTRHKTPGPKTLSLPYQFSADNFTNVPESAIFLTSAVSRSLNMNQKNIKREATHIATHATFQYELFKNLTSRFLAHPFTENALSSVRQRISAHMTQTTLVLRLSTSEDAPSSGPSESGPSDPTPSTDADDSTRKHKPRALPVWAPGATNYNFWFELPSMRNIVANAQKKPFAEIDHGESKRAAMSDAAARVKAETLYGKRKVFTDDMKQIAAKVGKAWGSRPNGHPSKTMYPFVADALDTLFKVCRASETRKPLNDTFEHVTRR